VLPTPLSMAIHDGAFFIVAMLAHGQLAEDRPGPRHLTRFYLILALGGVLGGLFNAIVGPLAFDQVLEYPLVLLAALLLRKGWSADDRRGTLWDVGIALAVLVGTLAGLVAIQRLGLSAIPGTSLIAAVAILCLVLARRPVRFGGAVGALLVVTFLTGGAPVFADRTFFGVHRVVEQDGRHVYLSGVTIHGAELLTPDGPTTPLAYFHRTGPAGQVFEALNAAGRVRDVGVIGLGAGSLAAYGQAGQAFTFYEIDPVVIRIASDPALFRFVSESGAQVTLVEGDGRLRIAEAPDASFDVVVLDAFSSDAVPAHIVTREAFELYLRKLRPNGLLLANVTNTYLDVRAVVAGGGQSAGLVGLARDDTDLTLAAPGEKEASSWIVLARSTADLGDLTTDPRWLPLDPVDRSVVWTDDFSDILSVLRR
jgi:SAM-dependent methyltransferase